MDRATAHEKVNYEDTGTTYGMYFLRDELGCENHGVTIVDADPGWEGPEHEHDDEDHEEVCVLVEGEATIAVGSEDVTTESGDAVRVPPVRRDRSRTATPKASSC